MTPSRAAFTSRHRATTVGIGLAFATALISGVSVFVNATALKAFGDAALYTTLKNGVAAILLLAMALPVSRTAWEPMRGQWRGLLAIGVIGGGIPFILFFTGLAEASAPSAAVIHKTLFAWVAVLAVLVLRERLGWMQIGAVGVLLVSQLLIQPPNGVQWGSGETMIALATGLWAIEVIVAKRVLAGVPAQLAAVARMGIGLIVLVAYLWVTGGYAGLSHLRLDQLGWLALTGTLLAGYVATWYAALQRAPATAVTAVLTLGLPITALLQMIANGQVPATGPTAGYGMVLVGVVVMAWLSLRRAAPEPAASEAAATAGL